MAKERSRRELTRCKKRAAGVSFFLPFYDAINGFFLGILVCVCVWWGVYCTFFPVPFV